MVVKTQCQKCGVVIRLDFGDMTKEEAVAAMAKMDNIPSPSSAVTARYGLDFARWWRKPFIRRACFLFCDVVETTPLPPGVDYGIIRSFWRARPGVSQTK